MNQEKYIGMDVHQATISVAVMDSSGKLIMECILETKAATILEFIDGLRGTLSVTFEEGTSAAWLHDLLKPHVSHLVVCDPRRNALLKDGRVASDPLCLHAVATTPAGSMELIRSYRSTDVGLPHITDGSAPASRVSRPAQRSLMLQPADSPSRLMRPFPPEASAALLPPPLLRLLPGGAIQFPGESFFSLWTNAFSRRTAMAWLRQLAIKT
jgi:hypothetical protein